MMQEKGFQFAEVRPEIEELSGGPKLVKLTFHMDDGPKVQIRNIDFMGNKAVSDGDLQGAMKQNKERWFLSWITGRGTYQENLFEEDAERIVEAYREKGYIFAQVGAPELEVPRRLHRRRHPLGRAPGPGGRGQALPRRQLHLRRQHGRQDPTPSGRSSS